MKENKLSYLLPVRSDRKYPLSGTGIWSSDPALGLGAHANRSSEKGGDPGESIDH